MQQSNEQWLPICGYEGTYEVSRSGDVRSLHGCGSRLLRPGTGKYGHKYVNLSTNGVQTSRYVHELVLETFVSKRPEGLVCCHENGNAADNRVENLRWDTQKANVADSVKHGTRSVGMRQEQCQRGHPLTAANSYNSDRKNGRGRLCKACALASAQARRRGIVLTQELADAKYQDIAGNLDRVA